MIFTVENALKYINKEIADYKPEGKPEELYKPIEYILELGGKRIRPLLAVWAYSMYKEDFKEAVKPSIALEVFHNFSLMHDDIMDKAPLRRGKKTVHEKWDSNTAILSGDVMLVKSYDLFLELKEQHRFKALTEFGKCAAEVCEGQQLDMNFESMATVSEEEYLHMIEKKTAALLGFSLWFGGLLADVEEKELKLLNSLGRNIGISFQLKDDLLDVYGDQKNVGKIESGDILANKKTYLFIKAFENSTESDQKKLKELYSDSKVKAEEKVKAVKGIFDKASVKNLCEEKMNFYFLKGMRDLNSLNIALYKKKMLKDFFQNLMNREG